MSTNGPAQSQPPNEKWHQSNTSDLATFIEFYERNQFSFDGADIFCMGPTRQGRRIAELLVVLLLMKDEQGRNPVRTFLVVLPPANVSAISEEKFRAHIEAIILRERGEPLQDEERAILQGKINVRHAPDLEVGSAIALIASLEPGSIAVVCDCALYRDRNRSKSTGAAQLTVRLEEDAWAQHLHALSSRGTQVVRQGGSYAVFDAGVWSPLRPANIELLLSIDHCGVSAMKVANGIEEVLASNADDWVNLARNGRGDSAIAAIDALPDSMNAWKGSLKIQILHHAGRNHEALKLIREDITSDVPIDGNVQMQLAKFAYVGGDLALARELLFSALPLATSQESLEVALSIARSITERGIENEALRCLERLFPLSNIARDHRIAVLLRDSRAIALGEEPPPPETGEPKDLLALDSFLRETFGSHSDHNYEATLATIEQRWPHLVAVGRLACSVNAHAHGMWAATLQLVRPAELAVNHSLEMYATDLLLDSLERALIERDRDFVVEQLLVPLHELLAYLARNPQDAERRVALIGLLSVQAAGIIGLPILAMATLELARAGMPIEPAPRAKPSREFSPDAFAEFFTGALSWLSENSPIVIGRTKLPKELLTSSADDLLHAIDHMAQLAGERNDDSADLEFMEQIAILGILVAPHSSSPNEDLTFLRLAAGRFAVAGRAQRARDFAEQALASAAGDPLRARLAWFTFADVYQRVANLPEALVGMACALASVEPVSLEQAFYETNALVRILRDISLVEHAQELLPSARALLKRLKLETKHAHRLDTLELSIRLRQLSASDASDRDLAVQVSEAAFNCRRVLDGDDEITPVAVVLAQSIVLAEQSGVLVDAAARETLDRALERMGPSTATLVRVTSDLTPLSTDVLELAHRMEAARDAGDIGFDIGSVVVAAQRLLASPEATRNPQVAAFAVELLADHAITLPGSGSVTQGIHWLIPAIGAPSSIAQQVSAAGVAVSILGLDRANCLAHVTVTNGVVGETIREEQGTFSIEKFRSWSELYPYRYGTERDIGNLFYTSMDGLRIHLPKVHRSLVVMDTRLQQLPPNLLLVDDELIGRGTAMGSAPSLAWLNAARSAPRPARRDRVSWISTAETSSSSGTLAMVAERLHEALAAHAFVLDTGAEVPTNLSGADMVVIAAHGGVAPEDEQYFQVVANEAELRISPMVLSRALAGARVVILFICSGGRFDKHPTASTTVGLPKELLNRGCRTILASPWPLDSRVPSHWLPAFLRVWDSGGLAIDANFQANKAVESAMGDSPELCLAMNLYGDPLSAAR